jgi:hypothetical protein
MGNYTLLISHLFRNSYYITNALHKNPRTKSQKYFLFFLAQREKSL